MKVRYLIINLLFIVILGVRLFGGYGELQFDGLLKIKDNNRSYWKVNSKQITIGYLRYKNNFKQMRIMSELELNDWENDFGPHFSGAYIIYDTVPFSFVYSYRDSKLLYESPDILHISNPYMWNIDDQKGITGLSGKGDIILPIWKNRISISYYGVFGEKYFSSYMASSNSTSAEIDEMKELYSKNDFYSGGGGLKLEDVNFKVNLFYSRAGYVFSSSNENILNTYFISATYKQFSVNYEQTFSFFSNRNGIEEDKGFFGNIKWNSDILGISFNYISFGSNFVSYLSKFSFFNIQFRPKDYLDFTSLKGPGIGISFDNKKIMFKEYLFLLDIKDRRSIYSVGQILVKPLGNILSVKILNYTLSSELGVDKSVFFAGINFDFKVIISFNYKYTIRDSARFDNFYAKAGYKFTQNGSIFLTYGDDGDPQSNPQDPGVLLYRIADKTQDSVALGVKFIF